LPKTYEAVGREVHLAGKKVPSTYIVSRGDKLTTANKHGLSHHELPILAEAAHEMKRAGPAVNFAVRAKRGESERDQRERISNVKKRLTIEQRRMGAKPYRLEVLEGSPSLHSHIVVSAPSLLAANDLIDRMDRSKFGPFLKKPSGESASKRVHNWNGLINYLLKESTPQAWAKGGKSFRRKRKAERTGTVSGDRVRLSKELERRLTSKGLIEPRRRTYAARLPKVIDRTAA
jgi:hypothetical protein